MTAKRKRTYLLLLGVGAAALFADRFLLTSSFSGPEEALAEDSAQATNLPTMPATSPAVGIPELSFPMELERYSPSARIADLFADPRDVPDSQLAAKTDKSGDDQTRAAAGTQLSEKLQGVYVGDNVQYAIIDSRPVKRGEKINGCTLIEVSGTRVKFLCVDREVMATVPTSAGAPPR